LESKVTEGATVAMNGGEGVRTRCVEVAMLGSVEVAIGVIAPLQLTINKLTNAKSTIFGKIFFIWVSTFSNYRTYISNCLGKKNSDPWLIYTYLRFIELQVARYGFD
jgi:hypothetical protein